MSGLFQLSDDEVYRGSIDSRMRIRFYSDYEKVLAAPYFRSILGASATLTNATARVVCMDNFRTGSLENVAHLEGEAHFEYIDHDVTSHIHVAGELDEIYHFASPAEL